MREGINSAPSSREGRAPDSMAPKRGVRRVPLRNREAQSSSASAPRAGERRVPVRARVPGLEKVPRGVSAYTPREAPKTEVRKGRYETDPDRFRDKPVRLTKEQVQRKADEERNAQEMLDLQTRRLDDQIRGLDGRIIQAKSDVESLVARGKASDVENKRAIIRALELSRGELVNDLNELK
jgi:hypothetical protein